MKQKWTLTIVLILLLILVLIQTFHVQTLKTKITGDAVADAMAADEKTEPMEIALDDTQDETITIEPPEEVEE